MKIGIADTTFAAIDLALFARKVIEENAESAIVVRYTVPGIKDLPVASKKLIEEDGCDIVIAMGTPGQMPIDKQCAHEASMGIIQAQLMTNRHIIEVFVHADEANNDKELYEIAKNRATKHALNAIALIKGKTALQKFAGQGKRQGKEDIGPIK